MFPHSFDFSLPFVQISVQGFTCLSSEKSVIGYRQGFSEDIGKPLYEVAFNPQDLREKIRKVPAALLEFHQKRGDFVKWIRDVFKDLQLAEAIEKVDKTGEDLRRELLISFSSSDKASCPRCGIERSPVKTWKMAGRPSKTGERLQLTIGHYKCPKCNKTFRKVIAKEKIKAS